MNIGRNEPCPCGSGKKFKKCHGSVEYQERRAREVALMRERFKAREAQRAQQQGLGRPIVSTQLDSGARVIAVGNRLYTSPKWKTFHDFLVDYPKDVIGAEWANAELKKAPEQQHPILVWYRKLCEHQRKFILEPGKVSSGPMTGATTAYLNLAYDLYALAHNAKLQAVLVARLRHPETFSGARYEIQVAASLIRAGFTIEFEDESDGSTTHCEFTATYTRTGKKFSVEAKRSESGRIPRPLVRALKKAAAHMRIVFIDMNVPDNESDQAPIPQYVQRAFDLIRRFEASDPQAQRLPPAHILLTNAPWEHHLDEIRLIRRVGLMDGFHIPECKADHPFASLREAISAREAHIEMHELVKSMRAHSEIPSTFDGENPELAFVSSENQLLIGNRYLVPDLDGKEGPAVLTSAAVMEDKQTAFCCASTDDGRPILFNAKLSDAEMAAWRKHPDTFFGEVSRNHKSESALDFYDFLMATYSKSSKEKLLEFMAVWPQAGELSQLSQAELASLYCERLASAQYAKASEPQEPAIKSRWMARPKA